MKTRLFSNRFLFNGFLFFVSILAVVGCRPSREQKAEVECIGSGTQGRVRVKAWAYAKRSNQAIEIAKKNAVQQLLFNGIGGTCPSKPMIPVADQPIHKKYTDDFLKPNGDWLQYVQLSGDGSIDPKDRLKVGRRYKIGVSVIINQESLRQRLEADRVIRKLGSGF